MQISSIFLSLSFFLCLYRFSQIFWEKYPSLPLLFIAHKLVANFQCALHRRHGSIQWVHQSFFTQNICQSPMRVNHSSKVAIVKPKQKLKGTKLRETAESGQVTSFTLQIVFLIYCKYETKLQQNCFEFNYELISLYPVKIDDISISKVWITELLMDNTSIQELGYIKYVWLTCTFWGKYFERKIRKFGWAFLYKTCNICSVYARYYIFWFVCKLWVKWPWFQPLPLMESPQSCREQFQTP